MSDGHHLPTQAMIAHFIVANQSGIDPARLPRDDGNIHKAQRSLSATMTYAMGAEPRRFRAEWLRGIAALCALDEKELRLLEHARSKLGTQLDPAALRQAVTATRATGLPADRQYPFARNAAWPGTQPLAQPDARLTAKGRAIAAQTLRIYAAFQSAVDDLITGADWGWPQPGDFREAHSAMLRAAADVTLVASGAIGDLAERIKGQLSAGTSRQGFTSDFDPAKIEPHRKELAMAMRSDLATYQMPPRAGALQGSAVSKPQGGWRI
jgi:hypothetical protein